MARPLWKVAIRLDLVMIPMALYPAESARGNVGFSAPPRSDLERMPGRWSASECLSVAGTWANGGSTP